MKLVVIVLSTLTLVWFGSLAYATVYVSTQQFLRPSDRWIHALEVRPTDNPTVWQFVKQNGTIKAEYKGELFEPLNPYVAKAIEVADRPLVVVVPSRQDWDNLPNIKDNCVYKFNDFYYLIVRGIATMYADFVVELETVDLSKIGTSGIPLTIAWVSVGTYNFKQKRTCKPKK